jgi:hypothetical protein
VNVEQALHNISLVLAEFKGSLKEHQALQQSLQVVKDALKAKEDAKPN